MTTVTTTTPELQRLCMLPASRVVVHGMPQVQVQCMNTAILEALLDCLSFAELMRLRVLNRAWLSIIRSFPLRLDRHLPPLPLRSLRPLRATLKRELNVTGLRLSEAGVERRLAALVQPERLSFLQIAYPENLAPSSSSNSSTSSRRPLDLSRLQSLDTLELDDLPAGDLEDFRACLPRLRSLALRRCNYLTDISAAGEARNLRALELRDCRWLDNLAVLENFPELERLVLSGLDHLDGAELVANIVRFCPRLTFLHVSRCAGVASLNGVEALPLKALVLQQLPNLRRLPPQLQQCKTLRTLVASGCIELRSVDALIDCTFLRELDISNTSVRNVDALATCTHLRRLDLGLCTKLESLQALRHCARLQAVSLWKCHNLRSLMALSRCLSLSWVDITGLNVSGAPLQWVTEIVNDLDAGIFAHRDLIVVPRYP